MSVEVSISARGLETIQRALNEYAASAMRGDPDPFFVSVDALVKMAGTRSASDATMAALILAWSLVVRDYVERREAPEGGRDA